MKIKRIIFALFMIFVLLVPIYAQPDAPCVENWQNGKPYDGDGDLIKVNGKRWIYDCTKTPHEFQLVDENYNVLESMTELDIEDPTDHEEGVNITVDENKPYGWVTLQAELPEEVYGKDVLISIVGDGGSGDYRLIKQNNYETTIQLPVGVYTIDSARIDGDLALTYSSQYNDETEVREEEGANIFVQFVKGNLLNEGKTEAAIIKEDGTEEEVNTTQKAGWIILYVIFGLIIVFSVILVVLLIRSRRDA